MIHNEEKNYISIQQIEIIMIILTILILVFSMDYVYCNVEEYFIINSFILVLLGITVHKTHSCKCIVKDNDDDIVETFDIKLTIGNSNVLQITSILNNKLLNHVLVTYDSI